MPPPDYSQRKDVRKAEKDAAIAERSRIAYTQRIMSEVEGREWMHALLTRCHVFATPFVRSAPDLTAFNCGEQNIGYQTFADVVNHCSADYIRMMQEANLKEITNGRRNPDPRQPDGSAGNDWRTPGPNPTVDGDDAGVWSNGDLDRTEE